MYLFVLKGNKSSFVLAGECTIYPAMLELVKNLVLPPVS